MPFKKKQKTNPFASGGKGKLGISAMLGKGMPDAFKKKVNNKSSLPMSSSNKLSSYGGKR